MERVSFGSLSVHFNFHTMHATARMTKLEKGVTFLEKNRLLNKADGHCR
jgi:hypothetical protein